MLDLLKTYLEIHIYQNLCMCLEFFSFHALSFYEIKDISSGNFQTTFIGDVVCLCSIWTRPSQIRINKYLFRFEFSSHLSSVYYWDRWWVNAKWQQKQWRVTDGSIIMSSISTLAMIRPIYLFFHLTVMSWTKGLGLMCSQKLECGIRIKTSGHGHICKEIIKCSYQEC